MGTKQHEVSDSRVVIGLTSVPYFATDPSTPVVVREASGLERVRDASVEADANAEVQPHYRIDRPPGPADDPMHFAGLGLAAVMDVGGHPIRARARRINVLTLVAITVILAVGAVMITLAATLKP